MSAGAQLELHHELAGPPAGPVVVLGPSLGTDLHLFDQQVEVLARDWCVLRFDLPGHGKSPAPTGACTMLELADAVGTLIDRFGVRSYSYAGVSIGGAIGLHLALQDTRLERLVVCASAAQFADPPSWHVRADKVRVEGTGFLRSSRLGTWYTPEFAEREPAQVAALLAMLDQTAPEGYAACCNAIAGHDVRARLAEIRIPTAVIAGEEDPATSVAMCREISDGIPGAAFSVIPHASHLLNVEQPEAVTSLILDHLTTQG